MFCEGCVLGVGVAKCILDDGEGILLELIRLDIGSVTGQDAAASTY